MSEALFCVAFSLTICIIVSTFRAYRRGSYIKRTIEDHEKGIYSISPQNAGNRQYPKITLRRLEKGSETLSISSDECASKANLVRFCKKQIVPKGDMWESANLLVEGESSNRYRPEATVTNKKHKRGRRGGRKHKIRVKVSPQV